MPPGHFVAELKLSQFRSHVATKLNLDCGLIALYGDNGVGKTNVLEALSLFTPGRGLRVGSAQDFVRRPGASGWAISGRLSRPGRRMHIKSTYRSGSTRRVTIDGKPVRVAELARVVRMLWLLPTMDRLWNEGAAARRRFLDRMTMSLIPDHAASAIAYDKSLKERNRLLKDGNTNDSWFSALERQMALHGAAISTNRRKVIGRIMRMQEATAQTFPAVELQLSASSSDRSLLEDSTELQDALGRHRRRDRAAGRSLIGPHRIDIGATHRDNRLAAKLCSTGEQKAMLLSIVLANALAIKKDSGAPPVLLLDEACAHLDGVRRSALFRLLQELEAQAWLTGTDQRLFSEISGTGQLFRLSLVDRATSVVAQAA